MNETERDADLARRHLGIGLANFDAHRRPRGPRDWHAARNDSEPRCGADQWRTRDRSEILYMHEMHDRHLGHCIRFATTKPQHASRLNSLLAESMRRKQTTDGK